MTISLGNVLEGLFAGLIHLEGQRIVHLDIKPQNLLVTHEGVIKIADFGIAQRLDLQDEDTDFPLAPIAGTPHYLAPEQVTGGRIGPWTKLYAVGMTAFELLVGCSPFAATRDPVEVVRRQLHDAVPHVVDHAPDIGPALSEWVDWLTSKAPGDRPQSVVEAWAPLESALTDLCGQRWREETTRAALVPLARRDARA